MTRLLFTCEIPSEMRGPLLMFQKKEHHTNSWFLHVTNRDSKTNETINSLSHTSAVTKVQDISSANDPCKLVGCTIFVQQRLIFGQHNFSKSALPRKKSWPLLGALCSNASAWILHADNHGFDCSTHLKLETWPQIATPFGERPSFGHNEAPHSDWVGSAHWYFLTLWPR